MPEESGLLKKIRADFPILAEKVNGHDFIYLDSAASAQKPSCVMEAMEDAARHYYANIHRGLYQMSERTSRVYEGTREEIARFLRASSPREIVFTGNATAGFNLLAHTLGEQLEEGDAVVLSELEHHANIVPWLMLRERKKIDIRVAPLTRRGDIDIMAYQKLFSDGRVRIASISQMSNVLGTITPIKKLAALAHESGAKFITDASQSAVHTGLDVQDMGVDFLVFTGHKLYGPTGVGVLWGKEALLETLPPFMGGGDMIESVSFSGATWARVPHRFEAGTPPILEVIGLGEAIRYLDRIPAEWRHLHEQRLLDYAKERLASVEGLRLLGNPEKQGPLLSFLIEKTHPHDLSVLLNQKGIAIRAGQHCAEPLMRSLGVTGTARISFGFYNTMEEIDAFMEAVQMARDILA